MANSFSTIIAGGLIGLGIASGGFLAGESLVKSRLGYRVVTVKGLSDGWWLRLQAGYDTAIAKTRLAAALEKIVPIGHAALNGLRHR